MEGWTGDQGGALRGIPRPVKGALEPLAKHSLCMQRRKLPESGKKPLARSRVTRSKPAEVLTRGWVSNSLLLSESSQAQKALYPVYLKHPEQENPQRKLTRGVQGRGGRGQRGAD